MGAPFNNDTWRLTNLYWQQRLSGGEFSVIGGLVDVTDYVDVYLLASPWTGFNNLVFSTGSGSIALPGDGGLGFVAGGALTENLYAIAGVGDTNADPTQPGDSLDSFIDDHEYFAHAEIGWVSSWARRYQDNAHLTVWHADEREDAAVADGWGANLSFARLIDERWYPFLRAGYANDGGSLLGRSVSAGLGYFPRQHSDLFAFGLNWGDPNGDSFGSGLDDQYTTEVFYRIQLSPKTALTPDIQYIRHPALNPDEDSLWVLGLRVRVVF